MKRCFFSLMACVALMAAAQYQRVVPLYEGAVPNNLSDIKVKEFLRPNEDSIYKCISQPRLVIFRPAKELDRHLGIVICPGGSYNSVCYGYEGRRVALALAERGYTSLVLLYRVPDDSIEVEKSLAPLQDLQQAIIYAREHAQELGFDQAKLGVMGFSAGGSLVSNALTHYDKELVNNPISNEALELIGFNDGDENRKPTDKVFVGFNDSLTQAPLKNWLEEAGITKHITYHCSRHTLGSLQVEAGTSVYTVQHILGHKNVATTQIYAAMADESKRESVDKITLKSAKIAQMKAV